MIISASYKTDIPAFYGDWFRARRAAGFCTVRNVWNNRDFRVPLNDADCSAFVFWTRNARPFRDELARTARTHPFTVQYTITGNPRWLERAVPRADNAIADIREIARNFGPDATVWRYDPVLISDETPEGWHTENATRIADALAGSVNEVVISFARIYRKTARNLARATEQQSVDWRDPDAAAKRGLLEKLRGIAEDRSMTLTVCTQPELADGLAAPARCIDTARLNRVAAHFDHAPVTARTKGPRTGCLCTESRDIGSYETCPHGCVYCYAVSDPEAARRNQRAHDPSVETLAPQMVESA